MFAGMKVIGGGTLVAAAVGLAVPAYAASSSPAAPAASAPTSSPASAGSSSAHKDHRGRRHGLGRFGLTRAVIAKAAGTDTAGLMAGRKSGKSLTQIAASHTVNRTTLLSRLDTTVDARVATLIHTKMRAKPGKACNRAMPKTAMGNHEKGPHKGHPGHGLRGIPGVNFKSLAGTLKVTPAELRSDLKSGRTLQQIATAHKVSTATLTAAIDESVNAALAKAVDRVPHATKAS